MEDEMMVAHSLPAEKKNAKITATDMFSVPFSRMRLAPNIRTDLGNILELAKSIKEVGVRKPMEGYKDKEDGKDVFVITDGQRRYRALELIFNDSGEDVKAPCQPRKLNAEQQIIEQLISAEGKPLTPLEQAEAFVQLKNFGYSTSDIAAKLGKSERYAQKLLKLAAQPKKFKNLVAKGTIAATYAHELIAKGQEAVDEIIARVEAGEPVSEEEVPVTKPKNSSRATITKGEAELNSMKELKQFLTHVNVDLLSVEKADFVEFLWRVRNNEVTFTQIKNYFNKDFKK